MIRKRLRSLIVGLIVLGFMIVFTGSQLQVQAVEQLKVQFYNQNTNASTSQIVMNIQLTNTGSESIPLSNVKLRYYYTVNGVKPQNFYCDYASIGSGNITGNFVTMAIPATGADTYVEIGFTTGSLAVGATTTVQGRIAKNDWSNYFQTDDYSFNPTATSFEDWTKVTGYISGILVWGTELAGTPAPTVSATVTPQITPTPIRPTPIPEYYITTGSATNIMDTSATLSGSAQLNGYSSLSVYIVYSDGTRSYSTAPVTVTRTQGFAMNVTGLKPSTKYSYFATVNGSSGGHNGKPQGFTTLASSVTPTPTFRPTPTPVTPTIILSVNGTTLSWTDTMNGNDYYVYRNNIQIAHVTGRTYSAVPMYNYYVTNGDGSVKSNTVYIGDATPSPTPPKTPTPIITVTPTATVTPIAPGGITIQMFNTNRSATTNTIGMQFKIFNKTGSYNINLADLKIRYYYTVDSAKPQSFWCDYATVGSANVTGTFITMATPKVGADIYLEIGFTSGAGTLAIGASMEMQIRFAKNDWSNYSQTNDYSYNSTAIGYMDWSKVTDYWSGTLWWGVEP